MTPDGLLEVKRWDDGVAWVDIRWPGEDHRYSASVLATITSGLRDAAADKPAVIVVASGAGDCLPGHYHCDDESSRDRYSWFRAGAMPMLAAVREMEPVTISVFEGDVTGMALLVGLACDARIATSTATLGIGDGSALPGVASLLRRTSGRAGLAAAIVGGADWSADEALRRQLVSQVLDTEDFRKDALRLAHSVAARIDRGPLIAKRMLRLPDDLDLVDTLDYELNLVVGPPAARPSEKGERGPTPVAGVVE